MPYSISAAAGTAVISTVPIILKSAYASGTPWGTVSVYDAAGTASLPGTPVVRLVWTGLADIGNGKALDIPLTTGMVVVAGTTTPVTYVYTAKGR